MPPENTSTIPRLAVFLGVIWLTSLSTSVGVAVFLVRNHASSPKHEGAVSTATFKEFKTATNDHFQSHKDDIHNLRSDLKDLRRTVLRADKTGTRKQSALAPGAKAPGAP